MEVGDLMRNMNALETHFNDKDSCPVMAMLKPSGNIIGSVPEETRGGETQEIDVMMNFGGIKAEFIEKQTSATCIKLASKGQQFFGKLSVYAEHLQLLCQPITYRHFFIQRHHCGYNQFKQLKKIEQVSPKVK